MARLDMPVRVRCPLLFVLLSRCGLWSLARRLIKVG